MTKDVTFKFKDHLLFGRVGGPLESECGVILLHGLTNSIDDCPNLSRTEQALWKIGIPTFAFDFYGSGKSSGQMSEKTFTIMKENVMDAIQFFKIQQKIKKIGLWGRSIGGSLGILAYDDTIVNSVALLSTPIFLVRDFSKFKKLAIKQAELEKTGKSLAGTGKYKGAFNLNMDFFRELPEIESLIKSQLKKMDHVLILATDPDEKVPIDNAKAMCEILADKCKMKIFYNTNHAYKGVEEEAIKLTVDWFSETLL